MPETNHDAPSFDVRTLIESANACYAKAKDQALPPPVRAKLARAADALVAAVDAYHEATAPPAPTVGGYDKDRCRSCGRIWLHHTTNCSNDRHRPLERPEWLDKAISVGTALDEAISEGATQLRNGTAGNLRAGANGERAGQDAMNGALSDQ